MANQLRGEAELKAGDRVLRVAFDWNAAAEFEDASGVSLSDALLNISRGRLSAKALRAMLWAGLQKHHGRDVDLQEAGRLIAEVGRKEAMRIMGVALRYFFPEIEEPTEGKGAGPAGAGPPPGPPSPEAPGPAAPSSR